MKKSDVKTYLPSAGRCSLMVCACCSYALSLVLFLSPNDVVAGGSSGLAVMIHYLSPVLSMGVLNFCINLPILLFGLKCCGWRFIAKCLLTISVLSAMIDVLSFLPPMTSDPLLASLYGGVCQGVGIGLFVRSQYSSGGTELLAREVKHFVKFVKIPALVGALDAIIVLAGTIVTKNPDNMLHALILIFVSAKVSEVVIMGLGRSKLCFIITDHGAEVSAALIAKSPRGITMLDGQGMYTGNTHNVLFTCVKNHQLPLLRQVVNEIDKQAFVVVSDSVEVRGKGFASLAEKD